MDNFINYKINVRNLMQNIEKVKQKICGRKFCAVVKSDCYGLGVENVVPYIDSVVDVYAVSNVGECKRLREITKKKILLLSEVFSDDLVYCVNNNVSVSVGRIETLKMIKNTVTQTINIHIKINTGMNRYGIRDKKELGECLKIIDNCNTINLEGVFTHFATAGSDIRFFEKQYKTFEEMLKNVPQNGLLIHCNNSSAAITLGVEHGNMVRVGFGMYGEITNDIGLKKVLTITAKILTFVRVKKGECVGYDLSYVAEKDLKLAVVGMGYADGFSRRLSNKFNVLVNGCWARVVGYVCMDCFMVDVTDIRDVDVGDEVIVLGASGKHDISLDDYAKCLETSPYEVLVGFSRKRAEIELIT